MGVIRGGTVIPGAQRRAFNPDVEGGYAGNLKIARADYDFAVDAGAVGTLALLGATDVPSGAIILGGVLKVVTVPTSGGGATMAIQVEAANDIVTAAAIAGAPWSTTGRKSVIPVFTGATSVETTAARDISLVIGTAALTAGKFTLFLVYIDPTAN